MLAIPISVNQHLHAFDYSLVLHHLHGQHACPTWQAASLRPGLRVLPMWQLSSSVTSNARDVQAEPAVELLAMLCTHSTCFCQILHHCSADGLALDHGKRPTLA